MLKDILRKFLSGFAAGILISIGGAVFLACENRYVGAVMFSVALLCICIKGYALYTGKIGFIPEKHGREEFSVLLLGLLGNVCATVLCGLAIRYAVPASGTTAETVCASKLLQEVPNNKKIVGILFCIPVFILAGFEHSVADMFYFSASGIVSWQAFGFIWNVILGNTVGAMILPLITDIFEFAKKKLPAAETPETETP